MDGAPQWAASSFPLRVCSQRHAGDEPIAVTASVIGVMNGRLGFAALQEAQDDCDVRVTVGVPAEQGWMDPGGDALLSDGSGGVSCDVRTSNVMGELLNLTIHHELGHCLGLAHDDFEQSVMRREQSLTPWGELPPWISDADRALLRGLYAQR
jgi:hypothetical protein